MEDHRMPKSSAEQVREADEKLRAAGLRPVQIWIPDTSAPGFATEAARQAKLLADWEASPAGHAEMAFWDAFASEAWENETD
jgi:Antitoxin MazE-like